ncbi:hypothetical protein [Arthrobacter sp. B0490]|uniref:hypothetical protein n=1 Tax=Arthrobacter sp. B0490 TaxID=2058891 RepID=UPI0021584E5B|nr:hypothetical protein [Arthrobacter sp. B0490]
MADLAATGWIESLGVRTPGLASVSAPVRSDDGIIAAVCLAMPIARVASSPGKDYGDLAVLAAQKISETMTKAN